MKYAFTIYGDEAQRDALSEEDRIATTQAYQQLTREMEEKGVLVAGEGLYPTSTATTVRVREGERAVTDGRTRSGGPSGTSPDGRRRR
jgi:hypothetical protein